MSRPKSIGGRGGVFTTVARGKLRPIKDHILVTDTIKKYISNIF